MQLDPPRVKGHTSSPLAVQPLDPTASWTADAHLSFPRVVALVIGQHHGLIRLSLDVAGMIYFFMES